MTANYVLLEKVTVGGAGATSVTFSNIPQTGYTDLVIRASARSSKTGTDNDQANLTFNSSSSGYSDRLLYARGSTTSSATSATSYITWAGIIPAANSTSGVFSNTEIYIPNYTSNSYKSISSDNVQENNSTTDNFVTMLAGLWSNTSSISSATLTCNGGSFVQHSTFYLYGVAKLDTTPAIMPYATGGDTIMTDGTYWYHAFRSSGTFTPLAGVSCDVLVVAGGGGGSGGGGGAGGVFYATAQSLASGTAYSATIGAGGAAGANGASSQFASLTAAIGGGTGGGYNESSPSTAASGGSGGGGGAKWNTSLYNQPGGSGTSSQGNTGGTGLSQGSVGVSNVSGGGGGGAGGVGGNASTGQGGAGGAGTNAYSAWLSTTGTGVSGFIAGGGGGGSYSTGGAGGSGGGGAGSVDAGVVGTANTGSGGGGGYNGGTGYTGGSGLVIVRYLV